MTNHIILSIATFVVVLAICMFTAFKLAQLTILDQKLKIEMYEEQITCLKN